MIVEAPNELKYKGKTVFLAGGITGCPDWQREMCSLLQDTSLVLLNPRRADFSACDAEQQITWEYRHLKIADAILFWFPRETLCPIVLYELGAWFMRKEATFVGVHPEYERRIDVEIQMRLARPGIGIVYSLEDLAHKARSLERVS